MNIDGYTIHWDSVIVEAVDRGAFYTACACFRMPGFWNGDEGAICILGSTKPVVKPTTTRSFISLHHRNELCCFLPARLIISSSTQSKPTNMSFACPEKTFFCSSQIIYKIQKNIQLYLQLNHPFNHPCFKSSTNPWFTHPFMHLHSNRLHYCMIYSSIHPPFTQINYHYMNGSSIHSPFS